MSEPQSQTSERPLTAVWLVAAVVVCRLLQIHAFPIYDDAFITWRYARNYGAGEGMVYNPGAEWEPVLGATTPLYALLMGLASAIGLPIPASSLALNVACEALSAWWIAKALGARPLAAIAAVLVFAVSPHSGRVAVGGMEPPLFVALAVGASVSAAARRWTASGFLAAFACTTRPEGVLLVAALAGLHLRSWRDALRFFVPVALVGAVSAGLLTWVYGSPIAQSVRAKAGRHGLGFGFARAWSTVLEAFAPSIALKLAAPLALFGIGRALRDRGALRGFVLFACLLPLAYIASGAKTWGWYFHAPLTAVCIGLGLACDALAGAMMRRTGADLARAAPKAAATLAGVSIAVVLAYTRAKPDVVTPRVYERMQETFDELDPAAAGARVMASDIGAVGWFSGATILDTEGLVWPPARAYPHQPHALAEHRAEYCLVVANRLRMGVFLAHEVSADYTPIARFNTTGASDLTPAVDSLPDAWVQDYLLYRRIDYGPRPR